MNGVEFFRMISSAPAFEGLHPRVGAFFKDYLSREKAVQFRGRYVINTHFPPWPGTSFDNLVEHYSSIGETNARTLYSVTLAVTNRCGYRCSRCYNAGRSTDDLPLSAWGKIIVELMDLNAVNITLSGGEPLLRRDLEDIAGLFDDRSNIVVNTTGNGLTVERAESLRQSGVFGAGISLDSHIPEVHDRLRGKEGAFDTAVKAVRIARDSGLYPYVIAVASRELLVRKTFESFANFAADSGAMEIHLLEPCPVGNLDGSGETVLDEESRASIFTYQEEFSRRDDLPVLSSFAYLESKDAFGCGAGMTHLYIDGTGEVCPCNFVPLSFGNAASEPLGDILVRMGEYFAKPRTECVGHTLAEHIPDGLRPADPESSARICREHLPAEHDIPVFFRLRESSERVGAQELVDAYDHIHVHYDDFWVSEAGKPVVSLVDRLGLTGNERIFEAGCGTGYATSLLAKRLGPKGGIVAVDISEGMLAEAERRFDGAGEANVLFKSGDALREMQSGGPYDLVFTSWVLGYIPLEPFFRAAASSLAEDGTLAFIVHRDNSPARELGIFREIATENPVALTKQIDFDFPRDREHLASELAKAGLAHTWIGEGSVSFRYICAEEALEHLLKSGAGTAFYETVALEYREALEKEFIARLKKRNGNSASFEVVHDYLACTAVKAG